MNQNIIDNTIVLILVAAIDDYAKATGKPISEVRKEIIYSGAYDDIYDLETGLWTQGPDYFICYFEQLKASRRKAAVNN